VNRITDLDTIEARLLELAHTTDAKLTAPALAYFAPCSVELAARVLDDLAARGQLTLDVRDDGSLVYEMPGRQKLAAPAPRLAPALVPIGRPVHHASPLLAALLSVWVPGAGHLYAGRFAAALLWFVVVGMGYLLVLPGLVMHLFCIASAAATAHRISEPPARRLLAGAVG
jgi:hypothetical protein